MTDDSDTRLRHFVRDRAGLDLRHIRVGRVARRLLDETGAADLDELRELAAARHEVFEAVVAALTVGETYFLRNTPQFDVLERDLLPGLVERRRSTRRLRLWSAGCSTGEEAYSLALLLERVIPDIERWSVSILATDINREALAAARVGVYSEWSLRGVPASVRHRWFVPHDDRFEVAARLRRFVKFAPLNLVAGSFPSVANDTVAVDLILCRNVLIYFHEDVARQVVQRLRSSLADDGWLLLGASEWNLVRGVDLVAHPTAGAVAFTPGPATVTADEHTDADADDRDRDPDRDDGATATVTAPTAASPPPADPNGSQPAKLFEQAKLHTRRLELEPAERLIADVLVVDPLFAPAHWLRALVLDERDRPAEAVGSLRRCLFLDPGFVLGRFALAGVLSRLGHTGRARRELDALLDELAHVDPDAEVAEGDGLTAGRLLELATVQRRLLDTTPNDATSAAGTAPASTPSAREAEVTS